jgi:uncharacterized peroxidase-related enzyme
MSIFPVHTLETAPEESKAPLEALAKAFGLIPNIAGVIANSPVLMRNFAQYFGAVHGGTLTEGDIQTLLLTNAVTNKCSWAVAFHSFLALQQDLTEADVEAIRQGRAPQTPRYAALSTYARQLIETRGHMGEDAVKALEAAGYRREQALEVIGVSAASTITNYVATLGQPPLEPMLQPYAWQG